MANAEQLLNEAQYAFQSITPGDSRDNRRNASRARSLCRKIIRKYATSTEAASALAILRRLGDETYVSNLTARHRHSAVHVAHEVASPVSQAGFALGDETMTLDWRGLLTLIFNAPKSTLAVIGGLSFVLFAVFGPFLLIPLVALIFFLGPFKDQLKPKQLQTVNELIARTNAYVEDKRKTGG